MKMTRDQRVVVNYIDDYVSLGGNRCPKWDLCGAGKNEF